MKVVNQHNRSYAVPPERIAQLFATLSTDADRVWPWENWPPMRFDGVLAPGAHGGHGPIRYRVEACEPGKYYLFRFEKPVGFWGTNSFRISANSGSTVVSHKLEMETKGRALLTWPLIFRSLHDALLEDCLHKIAVELGSEVREHPSYSMWVKFLRGCFRAVRKMIALR